MENQIKKIIKSFGVTKVTLTHIVPINEDYDPDEDETFFDIVNTVEIREDGVYVSDNRIEEELDDEGSWRFDELSEEAKKEIIWAMETGHIELN